MTMWPMAFTGRAIHPDYNVGLLLYDEVLDAVSARWQALQVHWLWWWCLYPGTYSLSFRPKSLASLIWLVDLESLAGST